MPFQNMFAVLEGLVRPVHADLVLPGQVLHFEHGVGSLGIGDFHLKDLGV
ncbi:hypothetical protein ig2599ANME_0122 [groundwater metagenome]